MNQLSELWAVCWASGKRRRGPNRPWPISPCGPSLRGRVSLWPRWVQFPQRFGIRLRRSWGLPTWPWNRHHPQPVLPPQVTVRLPAHIPSRLRPFRSRPTRAEILKFLPCAFTPNPTKPNWTTAVQPQKIRKIKEPNPISHYCSKMSPSPSSGNRPRTWLLPKSADSLCRRAAARFR